jgi:putative tryptophan/tyrosine transport system substrate-binding protein
MARVRGSTLIGDAMRKVAIAACLASALCSLIVPIHAGAQTTKIMRLGIICGVRCEGAAYDAFIEELSRLGWVEGRNILIDRRGAAGAQQRLPALAVDLVGLKPDLIVAVGPQPTHAAKDAAGSIPIVMVGVADPVGVGLVPDLARPGGTITGFTTLVPGGFGAKQLALLKEVLPHAARMAVLVNPKNDVAMKLFRGEMPAAAAALGVRLQMIEVSGPEQLEAAVDTAAREGAEGLHVFGDPMFHTPPERLPQIAARARLPTMFLVREVVQAGGLMSYGPDYDDMFRRAAAYVDRILKGARPAELPIQQPIKFDLVINLKTARSLGVTIPQSLLQRANEVIQ